MNAQEMAAVQGKALLDLAFDGRYLHWFDPVRGGPVASFDTVLPAVQRSPALINGGYAGPVAPHNEHNIVNLLIQADPGALNRAFSERWCYTTAMGTFYS